MVFVRYYIVKSFEVVHYSLRVALAERLHPLIGLYPDRIFIFIRYSGFVNELPKVMIPTPSLLFRPSKPLQERLFSFEFPESPGALLRFLNTLGTYWNISLFHYRSHGTDYGRVLAAFELGDHEPDFETRLNELGYDCHDETNNPAFRFFLAG